MRNILKLIVILENCHKNKAYNLYNFTEDNLEKVIAFRYSICYNKIQS